MPWKHGDLTAQTQAPTAGGSLMGYTTSLDGQGSVARVLYWGFEDGNVHELSLSGGGRWKHTDLTTQAHAPISTGSLMGYTTSLGGQGPVARVVFLDPDEHVHELTLSGSSGGRWSHADLTAEFQAPTAAEESTGNGGSLVGYTTSLGGQGPVARVVFVGHDQHVHELSLSDGSGRWSYADLTVEANAPPSTTGLMGYATDLDGQGPVARLLYWGFEDNDVHELSLSGGGRWKHTDLTTQAHAPISNGWLMGYTTSLGGQGPVARVVFIGQEDQHVHELSLSGGGRWKHTDLTDQAHAPTAFPGSLVGYTTSLDGQGPVARVLYWGYPDAKVRELSLSGGSRWKHADLTAQAHAPTTNGSLMGYTTSLGGQGPVARVVFLAEEDQHVHELFTFT